MATETRALGRAAWRHLKRHPWQGVLMALGVALGVAVVVAVDLANTSASRAFELSTEAVAGRATHAVRGGPEGLDEDLYAKLKRDGVATLAAPVVNQYVSSEQLGDRAFRLLGIDPFADAPFRNYLVPSGDLSVQDLRSLLTRPGAVLISSEVAERYGLSVGDSLTLTVSGYTRDAHIVGLLQPNDTFSKRALSGLIIADVATAQELTERTGRLDRIDLILPEAPDAARQAERRIRERLPEGARLQPVGTRTGAIEQMTAAFQTNLTALSLLALVVGVFLIYNTMTFAVVQRRALFGTLRSLGATRRQIFQIVLIEAGVIGMISSALGIGLGIVLGQGAVELVTRTINDLYVVLTVQNVGLPVGSLVKGALLGLVATLTAAAFPAWEAAATSPSSALSRAGLESKARRVASWSAWGGVGGIALGLSILAWPTRDLTVSFVGTSLALIGAAMVTPLATSYLMKGLSSLFGRIWRPVGPMAPREVSASLSRTSIAVAALVVAVSVTIGVGLMVTSFRTTVVDWLDQSLSGDVYVWAPGFGNARTSATLDPDIVDRVNELQDADRVDALRSVIVNSPQGSLQVDAVANPSDGQEHTYLWTDGPVDEIWQEVRTSKAVIASEPLARRLDLSRTNDELTLFTDEGRQTFEVVGVYYDYGSSQGIATMWHEIYRQYWDDTSWTALSINLPADADADRITRQLQAELTDIQRVQVQANRELRAEVLAIFDQTFAITSALQLLAIVVAFIGVLSALLSLQLEKTRQLGILRALGFSVREIWALITMETGLIGTSAGLLAMPTGLGLALILIYIINRRAFGWTLLLQLDVWTFVQALAVAIGAALLAGLYPAYRMSRIRTAAALRNE